jgi:hypothetical protein
MHEGIRFREVLVLCSYTVVLCICKQRTQKLHRLQASNCVSWAPVQVHACLCMAGLWEEPFQGSELCVTHLRL